MKRFAMVFLAGLAGCSSGGKGPDTRPVQLDPDGAVAETVNGTPVPQSLLEAAARSRNLHLDRPEQREQALHYMTDLVLMAQAAERENFYADPQFRNEVELGRLKGVADAGAVEFQKQTPIGEDVLKAQYEDEIAHAGKLEYDFGQLLFANEDDALKAEEDVLAGKPFQTVYDAWRGKAKQAKVFTRVRLDQVPEALGKALASMKNGDTTKVPVHTEFGWHVVHLDIANPFTPPPYEQVKEGIRHSMQIKVAQQRLEKLRETAKVEYPAGSAPPPPAEKPAPAPAEKGSAPEK
ncbi:MAG TPA: peptidylprolyl isomerase [Rudaea sp.]|nr:peptidylprolyl isomerase [Rudaea sp.]